MQVLEKITWDTFGELQLFYERQDRCLIIKQLDKLYLKYIDDPSLQSEIEIYPYSQPFLSLSKNPNNLVVAFQLKPHQICILQPPLKKTSIIKFPYNKAILGYHWVRFSNFCDFFTVNKKSLDFFKLKKERVKKTKSFELNINKYWFQNISGIILIESKQVFYIFHAKPFKSQTTIKGGKFIIQNYSETSQFRYNRNFLQQIPPDKNQFFLACFYEKVYCLYLNQSQGKLLIVNLENSQQRNFIGIKKGKVQLRLIRDLLVIQNYSQQQCLIYDIDHNEFVLVAKIWQASLSRISEQRPESFELVDEAPILYSPQALQQRIFLDSDLQIDPQGICLQFSINPVALVQSHHDPIFSILFLLRRQGCKFQASEKLRTAFQSEIQLVQLNKFFKTINLAFLEHSEYSKYKDSFFQTEICQLVQQVESQQYKSSVLLLYLYSLIRTGIEISENLSLLVAQSLIRLGNLQLLIQLIEHDCLNQSESLANLLVNSSSQLFAYGLDMLYRLNQPNGLILSLLSQQYDYQVLQYYQNHQVSQLNPEIVMMLYKSFSDKIN